jgi:hypothetical protein
MAIYRLYPLYMLALAKKLIDVSKVKAGLKPPHLAILEHMKFRGIDAVF